MDRKYLFVLAAGAVIVAATVWLTLPGRPKSVGDPSKYRYMHCPECKREKMYTPAGFDLPCAYCEKTLVATEQSVAAGGGAGNSASLTALLVGIELVALMGAILLVARRPSNGADDEYLYISCAKCRQKIRFHVNQVGQPAMCRRCKHAFRYPEADED